MWLLHVHQYLVKDPDPSPHYAYCLMFAHEKQWFLLESISNEPKVHREDNNTTCNSHKPMTLIYYNYSILQHC